jgi:hypothetical protein
MICPDDDQMIWLQSVQWRAAELLPLLRCGGAAADLRR